MLGAGATAQEVPFATQHEDLNLDSVTTEKKKLCMVVHTVMSALRVSPGQPRLTYKPCLKKVECRDLGGGFVGKSSCHQDPDSYTHHHMCALTH